jgi:hypothetical protein
MSTESKLKAVREHSLFGPPPLLEGEDEAVYDELLGRVCAAVKPVDVIDEILMVDVVFLEWDVLRLRRWKTSRIRSLELNELERFLTARLDYDHYRDYFQDDLTEILQANLTEDDARRLAQQCAMNERGAVDKVNQVLQDSLKSIDTILDRAQARKAEESAQAYMRREQSAANLISNLLAQANLSIEDLLVRRLARELDNIERIDRLITIAENRRNAMLREIDRRRAVLGEALRRKLQEVEGEFEVIDKTPDAKSAA